VIKRERLELPFRKNLLQDIVNLFRKTAEFLQVMNGSPAIFNVKKPTLFEVGFQVLLFLLGYLKTEVPGDKKHVMTENSFIRESHHLHLLPGHHDLVRDQPPHEIRDKGFRVFHHFRPGPVP